MVISEEELELRITRTKIELAEEAESFLNSELGYYLLGLATQQISEFKDTLSGS